MIYELLPTSGFLPSLSLPLHPEMQALSRLSLYFTLVAVSLNFLQIKNRNSRHVLSLTKSYHNKIV